MMGRIQVIRLFITDFIELYVKEKSEEMKFFEICCKLNKIEKVFKTEKNLSFQKLKFKILALFPELEQENYSLIYNKIDITNIFGNEIVINDIFLKENSSNKIKLNILTQPKNFVEYHKKCSFCYTQKAINICNVCAIASCGECCHKDSHMVRKNECFVQLKEFKEYEQSTLLDYLNSLMKKKDENAKLQSNNFSDIISDKMNVFNKKFNEMIDLINQIKNYQYTNLVDLINLLKSFHPEELEKKILDLYKIILEYKENPYYDCEESMKKVLELESLLNSFNRSFSEYKSVLESFSEKYIKCIKINNSILESLKNSYLETKSVFRKSESKERFNVIMKIYDQSSVLVYDPNNQQFSLMNFIDKHNFKNNYNNFVQINYSRKLFIITGNPCQMLFVYDYETNELEYINSLRFSHNWWPVLIIKPSEEELYKISLFCFSGTYTKKCEELFFRLKGKKEPEENQVIQQEEDKIEEKENNITDITLDWKEIPTMTNCHGQGAAYVFNQSIVYVLFGYDSKFNSTGSIERMDLVTKGNWEQIQFQNPNKINALLYYHAVMRCDENSFYVIGGMKEVNITDVIYKFNMATNELTKTDYEIPIQETKFYNEKNFYCYDKEGSNTSMEDLGKRVKLGKEESLQKLIKTEVNKVNSNYAIFDAYNNIHMINIKGFSYDIKKYNEN
jgi:hypothetical protein